MSTVGQHYVKQHFANIGTPATILATSNYKTQNHRNDFIK